MTIYESLNKVMKEEIQSNPGLSKLYDNIIAKAVKPSKKKA